MARPKGTKKSTSSSSSSPAASSSIEIFSCSRCSMIKNRGDFHFDEATQKIYCVSCAKNHLMSTCSCCAFRVPRVSHLNHYTVGGTRYCDGCIEKLTLSEQIFLLGDALVPYCLNCLASHAIVPREMLKRSLIRIRDKKGDEEDRVIVNQTLELTEAAKKAAESKKRARKDMAKARLAKHFKSIEEVDSEALVSQLSNSELDKLLGIDSSDTKTFILGLLK